ncbi:MAG: hypothetical protein KAS64_07570 [Spirochaetes bacterium]|nr:hypothetical protein [Spirochaetota bacterium]
MKIIENPSIVLLGMWNLGILQPKWFIDEFPDIIKEKEIPFEVNIQINALRFTIDDGNIQINPMPDKLIIRKIDGNTAVLDKIINLTKGIVKKLPHTPITAIGHNIGYELEESEEFGIEGINQYQEYEDKYKEFYSEAVLLNNNIKHSISFTDFTVNINYQIDRTKKNIGFNYNYPIKDRKTIENAIENLKMNIVKSTELYGRVVKNVR